MLIADITNPLASDVQFVTNTLGKPEYLALAQQCRELRP